MKKDDRFSPWEWSFLEVLWKRRAYPKWGRSVFLSTTDILDIASGGFTYPKEAKGNKKPIGFYVSELLQKCGIPNKHRTNGGKRWQTVALRKFLRDLFSEETDKEEPLSDPEDPTLAAYGESEERAKHFRALFSIPKVYMRMADSLTLSAFLKTTTSTTCFLSLEAKGIW